MKELQYFYYMDHVFLGVMESYLWMGFSFVVFYMCRDSVEIM